MSVSGAADVAVARPFWRRRAPELVAAAAILAFFAGGLMTAADRIWTRDGYFSQGRARTTLKVMSSVRTGAPVGRIPQYMNHPTLAPTVAYVLAREFPVRALPYRARYNLPFFVWATFGLAFLFLFLRRTFDGRVAAMAVILMAGYPRLFHAAHEYHKDVPVVTGGILAMWAVLRAVRDRRPVGFALAGAAVGLASSFHFIALIFIPMFFAAEGVFRWSSRKASSAVPVALFLAALVATLFVLNPILWVDPLRIFRAVGFWSSNFWAHGEPYLGRYYRDGAMPWHYIWVHFLAAAPLVHLGGFALGLPLLFRKPAVPTVTAALLVAFFAPMAIYTWTGGARYDGLRHVFVVLPAFVTIAALGIVRTIDTARFLSMPVAATLAALVVGGVAFPVREIVTLHPFQEMYFNEVARHLTKGNFNTVLYSYDYDNPVPAAIRWLDSNAAPGSTVRFSGFLSPDGHRLRKDLVFTRADDARYRVCRNRTPDCVRGCENAKVAHMVVRYNTRLATIYECR